MWINGCYGYEIEGWASYRAVAAPGFFCRAELFGPHERGLFRKSTLVSRYVPKGSSPKSLSPPLNIPADHLFGVTRRGLFLPGEAACPAAIESRFSVGR
jgi:hypothetical protein